uniref:TNFR-Cys domain-containing protein n=1 Tax=Macrostomum lignano TaxID=282301 RepID=A0A1I8IKS9_9PLAT
RWAAATAALLRVEAAATTAPATIEHHAAEAPAAPAARASASVAAAAARLLARVSRRASTGQEAAALQLPRFRLHRPMSRGSSAGRRARVRARDAACRRAGPRPRLGAEALLAQQHRVFGLCRYWSNRSCRHLSTASGPRLAWRGCLEASAVSTLPSSRRSFFILSNIFNVFQSFTFLSSSFVNSNFTFIFLVSFFIIFFSLFSCLSDISFIFFLSFVVINCSNVFAFFQINSRCFHFNFSLSSHSFIMRFRFVHICTSFHIRLLLGVAAPSCLLIINSVRVDGGRALALDNFAAFRSRLCSLGLSRRCLIVLHLGLLILLLTASCSRTARAHMGFGMISLHLLIGCWRNCSFIISPASELSCTGDNGFGSPLSASACGASSSAASTNCADSEPPVSPSSETASPASVFGASAAAAAAVPSSASANSDSICQQAAVIMWMMTRGVIVARNLRQLSICTLSPLLSSMHNEQLTESSETAIRRPRHQLLQPRGKHRWQQRDCDFLPRLPLLLFLFKRPEHFAGCTSCRNVQDGYQCNSTSSCTLGDSCQVCSSDFCNAVYPSSISCFYRRGMPSNANDNGTKINCYYGVATCYTYMSSTSNYVGCGDCSTRDDPTCVTCNSAYCNTINPSSISCYVGTQNYGGSLRNGSAIACPTGVTSCFAYRRLSTRNVYSSSFTSGCGACNSTDNPTCANCSTDLCNTVTPSAISCNLQTVSDSTNTVSHGNRVACQSGITSCYSTMISNWYNAFYDYGCGSCSADVMPSCVNCATDNCNTADRTGHTCYSLTSSPYPLRVPLLYFPIKKFNITMSGCGVCTPTSTALYGCTSCNTSNCNAPANSSSSLPPGQSNPTANPAITASGIDCYQSFSKNKKTEQQKTSCPSYSSCFDYTFKSGSDRDNRGSARQQLNTGCLPPSLLMPRGWRKNPPCRTTCDAEFNLPISFCKHDFDKHEFGGTHLLRFTSWETSGSRGLSRETFLACRHTCRAIAACARHLLDREDFSYVLLGALQSDSIERTFGWLRQMSGANYFISARQLSENNQKIAAISLLKFSQFSLHDIDRAIAESTYFPDVESNMKKLTQEMAAKMEMTFQSGESDCTVICYMSGCIAKKLLQNRRGCESCRELLLESDVLPPPEADAPVQSAASTFIDEINRGGLSKPAAIAFNLASHCWGIFEEIRQSETLRSQLLCASSQVLLFSKLVDELMEDDVFMESFFGRTFCSQGHCIKGGVVRFFFNSMIKNLSKDLSAASTAARRRKVAKLSSLCTDNPAKTAIVIQPSTTSHIRSSPFPYPTDFSSRFGEFAEQLSSIAILFLFLNNSPRLCPRFAASPELGPVGLACQLQLDIQAAAIVSRCSLNRICQAKSFEEAAWATQCPLSVIGNQVINAGTARVTGEQLRMLQRQNQKQMAA